MRSDQLFFIVLKVEGHVILFAFFLVGTCLSQTLVISVGIALFASIAVLQTTVNLVLEGINTRSFHCCPKVLKLVHSMRKGKYSWNTLETWKLSSFSLLTSVLMFPFYFFSVVYGGTFGDRHRWIMSLKSCHQMSLVSSVVRSNSTFQCCLTS